MKAVLVVGNNASRGLITDSIQDAKLVIGCDKGALRLAKEGIHFDKAIGDFDSVNQEEFLLIQNFAKEIEKLNPIKDDTDTAHALKECSNFDEIEIIGAIQGKRIEHLFANIIELCNDKRIRLIDDNSLIRLYEKGESEFSPSEYRFFSVFALTPTLLSLNGFAYDLDSYLLKPNDPLCVSNQIKAKKASMYIDEGKVIVILSKQD